MMPKATHAPGSSRAIQEIETGLRSLSRGLKLLVKEIGPTTNGHAVRRRPVTPALRLQGRYMGLIRMLPKIKKSRVMSIRASKGVEAAIRMAKSLRAAH